MSPAQDPHPPILHAAGWKEPQPLPGPINTPGGEDAPFIPLSGESLLFFFTPDVSVPAEKQLLDGVTGLYQAHREAGSWTEPRRLVLNDDLSLDGCPFALGDQLWFCTVRPGYDGPVWFIADFNNGAWGNWHPAEFDPEHQVGELHISADGNSLFFHSDRAGTVGRNDLWLSQLTEEGWGEPRNIAAVNTAEDESRPFLSADGRELWFTRTHQGTPGVFRSVWSDGGWKDPELILSQFAGEPTLDPAGNIYFVHHFFQEGQMLEADIYVALKE